jgi:hypothetical protein
MNDCVARAKAMGATYTLLVDFDEFVFPLIPGADLQRALDATSGSVAQIMPSFFFHSSTCLRNLRTNEPPQWYHDFLNTFRLARADVTRVRAGRAGGSCGLTRACSRKWRCMWAR